MSFTYDGVTQLIRLLLAEIKVYKRRTRRVLHSSKNDAWEICTQKLGYPVHNGQ